MSKSKKFKPWQAYGILNSWGEFWTRETFDSEEDALDYMEDFLRRLPGIDLSRHQVIRVLISPLPTPRKVRKPKTRTNV
jgi:hypothetical protein